MNSPQGGASLATKPRRPNHRPQTTAPRQKPTIGGGVRGFVFVRVPALLKLYRMLASTSSSAIAMGDIAEWLVLAIDVATNCDTIDAGGHRAGVGYRHRLLAPGSWDVRRRRLVAAGLLKADRSGRITGIAACWRDEIFIDTSRHPNAKLGLCTPVHRDHLRPLVTQLRDHRNEQNRPLPGIGRLLILLIILGAPKISNEHGHILKSQQQLSDMLNVRRPTITQAMATLADLGIVTRPLKRRHGTALRDPDQHAWVYLETRDRLAGRTWQTLPPGTDTPPPPADGRSGRTYGFNDPLPPPGRTNQPTQREGGFLTGSTTTPGRATPPSTACAVTSGSARQHQTRPWSPGPATKYPGATITAVNGLVYNLISLQVSLTWWAAQPSSQALCAAVTAGVNQARQAKARHDAGEDLTNNDRNLIDAVARLARAIDHLNQAPCPDLYAHFLDPAPEATAPEAWRWFDTHGQLRPYTAVLLLAGRIAPHAQRARADPTSQAGNWRRHTPRGRPTELLRNTKPLVSEESSASGFTTMEATVTSLTGPVGEVIARLATTAPGTSVG